MAASSSGLLTGIIINIVTCIIAFLIFSLLRRLACCKKYYAPKRYHGSPSPEPLPDSFFGWIWPIIMYEEPKIITSAGLDTALYLRVLKFGLELFFYVSLWCLVTMLPVNMTDNYIDTLILPTDNSTGTDYTFTEFDKLGLANITPSSNRMWIHLTSVYVVTFITLWLLYRYSKESVLLRIMFLANSVRGRSSHTVLVTDIPGVAKNTSKCNQDVKVARKLSRNRSNRVESDPGGSSRQGATTVTGVETSGARASGTQGPTSSELRPLTANNVGVQGSEAGQLPPKGPEEDILIISPSNGIPPPPPPPPPPPAAPPPPSPPDSDVPPEDDGLAGASTEPVLAPSDQPPCVLRQRRRYNYDLKDETLDPTSVAEKAIESGLGSKAMVAGEFDRVYPKGAVAALQMVCNQNQLTPLVNEYNKVVQKLDDYLDECNFRLDHGKEVARKKVFVLVFLYGIWGKERYGGGLIKRVDAFDHYIARLKELERLILEEQPLAGQMMWPSAFVTFESRVNQAVASTSLHAHDTGTWITRPAPEPYELIWPNLGMTQPYRSTLNTLMWCLFWIMCMFFMIPVGGVQALIEVPRLSSYPIIGGFVGNPVVSRLLQGIVPGLALKIFLILVPPILRAMIKTSGAVSESEVDMGTVSRYFVFQVIVVFFGTVIMGSFFNQVTQWIQSPASVISVLGTAIPLVVTFFCNFIAVNGLTVKPLAFIRGIGLIIFWLIGKLSGSPKARARLWQEQYTLLGTTVVDHTITILLGVVYSCINPIICPFALTYFAINYVIERYQNIYVFRRNYESNGSLLWPKVLNQVLTSLYIFQLTMLGLLGLKKFVYTPALIPVLVVTFVFHIVCLGMFSRPWNLMSMHDAAELDIMDQEADAAPPATDAEDGGAFDRTAYLSPCFKIKAGQIDTLLAEAAAMAERLNELQEGKMKEEQAK